MTSQRIKDQLERTASAGDFAVHAKELATSWSSGGAGLEFVEPILQFMESHPAIDFAGTHGPLIRFMERFQGLGYEEKLVESILRKPTVATVAVFDSVIHATQSPETKRGMLATLKRARLNPHADQATLQEIGRCLKELSR